MALLTDDKAIAEAAGKLTGVLPGLGVGVTAKLSRLPGEGDGADYAATDITAFAGDGYRSTLVSPRAYKESVDLSLIPFVSNVGSFLKAKGVITNDVTAFIVDAALDPGNLVGFGLGQLTKAGKAAKLISLASEGGRITDGAEVLNRIHAGLETAAKLAGSGNEVTQLAKAGDLTALKGILSKPVSEAATAADKAVLEGFAKHRKELATILKNGEELAWRTLTKGDVLQKDVLSQVFAGQRTLPLYAVNPFAEGTSAMRAARQIVGFHTAGEAVFNPASRLLADAMDSLGVNKGVPQLAEEFRLRPILDKIAERSKTFTARQGEVAPYHLSMAVNRLKMLGSLPNERSFAPLLEGQITDEMADGLARQFYAKGVGSKVSAEERAFARIKGLEYVNADRVGRDKVILAARDNVLTSVLTQQESAFNAYNDTIRTLGKGQVLDTAVLDADRADLRKAYDLFGLSDVAFDPQGLRNKLMSRVSYGGLIASQHAGLSRQIVMQGYAHPLEQEAILAALSPITAHFHALTDIRDGRIFLKDGVDIGKVSPLLKSYLDNKVFGPKLTEILGKGLDPNVSQVAAMWRDALDSIGGNVYESGIIGGVLNDYFPRVVGKFHKKFYDELAVPRGAEGQWIERLIAGDEAAKGGLPGLILGADGSREFIARYKSGKVSMEESRAWAENIAVMMEEKKYLTYNHDAVNVMSGYMESANRALVINKLFLDGPLHASLVDRNMARMVLGAKAGDALPEEVLGKYGMVVSEDDFKALPPVIQKHYAQLTSSSRILGPDDDIGQAWAVARARASQEFENKSRLGQALRETSDLIVSGKNRVANVEAAISKGFEEAATAAHREWGRVQGALEAATAAAGKDATGSANRVGRAVEAVEHAAARQAAGAERAAQSLRSRAGKLLERAGAAEDKGARASARSLLADAAALERDALGRKGAAQKLVADSEKQIERLRQESVVALEVSQRRIAAATLSADRRAAEIETRRIASVRARFQQLEDAKGRMGKLRDALNRKAEAMGADAAQATARSVEGKPLSVYALAPLAAQMRDALRLYKAGETDKVLRAYDQINGNLKAIKLFGDFFHFNTLGIHAALTSPREVLRILSEDAANLRHISSVKGAFENAIGKAALGAAGGAALAPVFGADEPGQIAGMAGVGAIYGALIGAAVKGTKNARFMAFMNPEHLETLRYMALGGWIGRPDDRGIGHAQLMLKNLRTLIMRDASEGTQKLLVSPLTRAAHLMDGYDETMWASLQNGGKMLYFSAAFYPAKAKLEASEAFLKATSKGQSDMLAGVAREIMQGANNAFGGQQYANLFANPEFERWLRRFLISPDWTSSRLQLAASMFGNTGALANAATGGAIGASVQYAENGYDMDNLPIKGAVLGAAGGLAAGRWAREVNRRMLTPGDAGAAQARKLVAGALLGGYVAYNLLNKALSGRWMWENEAGHNLEVAFPDGLFLHPGKPFTEPFEFAGVLDNSTYPVPYVSRLASKLAPPIGAFVKIVSNKDSYGAPLILPGDQPWTQATKYGGIATDFVVPIFAENAGQAVFRSARGEGGPNDYIRAGAGIAGFSLRGRGIPQPEMEGLPLANFGPPPALTGSSLLGTALR